MITLTYKILRNCLPNESYMVSHKNWMTTDCYVMQRLKLQTTNIKEAVKSYYHLHQMSEIRCLPIP